MEGARGGSRKKNSPLEGRHESASGTKRTSVLGSAKPPTRDIAKAIETIWSQYGASTRQVLGGTVYNSHGECWIAVPVPQPSALAETPAHRMNDQPAISAAPHRPITFAPARASRRDDPDW